MNIKSVWRYANLTIVFDDADIKKAADMAIAAKFRNNGQVCISPNRFYIQESKKDEFVN